MTRKETTDLLTRILMTRKETTDLLTRILISDRLSDRKYYQISGKPPPPCFSYGDIRLCVIDR